MESAELRELFRNKYRNVKNNVKDKLDSINFGQTFEDVKERAEETWRRSSRAVRKAAQKIDNSVHDRPWIYLGVATMLGTAVGYYAGRRKR